jgi:hypothetical protein
MREVEEKAKVVVARCSKLTPPPEARGNGDQ